MGVGTAGIRCHEHCRNAAELDTAGILCCWALQEYSAVAIGHCKNVLRLGTAGILGGYSAVGHCRDALWLGTAGMLCGWAQGYLVFRHCEDTWWLGTAGFLAGHCMDMLRLGTAATLGGWALQGCLVVAHCRDGSRRRALQHRLLNLTTSL